jgi:flagellar basal-body rod modification protein FlgD
MTTVQGTGTTNSIFTAASQSAAKSTKTEYGGTEFMTVLLAQLKNQNPLEPMQDKDIMAQMAQLNSLEELQNIKSKMAEVALSSQASLAASLIGKRVKATLSSGDTVDGIVSGTAMSDGSYVLKVGNQSVPLSSVNEITEA